MPTDLADKLRTDILRIGAAIDSLRGDPPETALTLIQSRAGSWTEVLSLITMRNVAVQIPSDIVAEFRLAG